MSTFDASRFLEPELPLAPAGVPAREDEPTGRWSDLSPPVADVAEPRRREGDVSYDQETGEILDGWAVDGGTVAAVAGVAATHDLVLTAPFARELNAMFFYPVPSWLRPGAWRKLCEAARVFADTKAQDALSAGWEPIELFGVHRHPWRRTLAADGLLWLAHGRTIGRIEPHAIEILNKVGAHNRAYRAHFMTQRHRAALMWDAFHPSNRRPLDDDGMPIV